MMATSTFSPFSRAAEELERSLPDPVPVREVAKVMGVSVATAYAMCHRFIAAKVRGDVAGMRDAVPCVKPGPSRYVVPRAAFIAFYVSAGLPRELLEELYGRPATGEEQNDGRAA